MRNRVAVLRGLLTRAGGFIDTDGAGYLLRVGPGELDAAVFDDLVERGRAGADPAPLRAALALWRGPALAGLGGPVLAQAAAELEDKRLAAHEECIELELAAGAHDRVVDELAALVAANPLRERLVGQLMVALHRCGRTDEAMGAYHRLAGRLADELGIDPAPELRRVRESIRRPAPPSPDTAVVPSQLPADVAGFTGRSSHVAGLDQVLSGGPAGRAVVISAIAGTAGVGKTNPGLERTRGMTRYG